MTVFIEDEVIDPPPYSFVLVFPSTEAKHDCMGKMYHRDINAWVLVHRLFKSHGKRIRYTRPDDFCRPSFLDEEANAIAVLFRIYEDMGFGLAPPQPE